MLTRCLAKGWLSKWLSSISHWQQSHAISRRWLGRSSWTWLENTENSRSERESIWWSGGQHHVVLFKRHRKLESDSHKWWLRVQRSSLRTLLRSRGRERGMEPLWLGPYIINRDAGKGLYKLCDTKGKVIKMLHQSSDDSHEERWGSSSHKSCSRKPSKPPPEKTHKVRYPSFMHLINERVAGPHRLWHS